MQSKTKTIIITGPTATGKTSLAVHLAQKFNGEIISADSRQVYQGLDIGSGKDIAEYANIPYHLIDVIHPNDNFNLMKFCTATKDAICTIRKNNKTPFIAGGTALYLNAILSGYKLPGTKPNENLRLSLNEKSIEELTELCEKYGKEHYSNSKETNNRTRMIRAIENGQGSNNEFIPFNESLETLILGVYYTRSEVRKRIEDRLDARIEEGMIDEVEGLHNDGVSWEKLDFFGLEYRFVAQFLQGIISKQEMRDRLLIKIHQFAKRQDAWFRKLEREGKDIYWLEKGNKEQGEELIYKFLNNEKIEKPKFQMRNVHYGPVTSKTHFTQ